jgi:CRISPR-associated protein Cst1
VAKYYNEENNEAIVTIEDYAEYLFPDTNSWQETRDVLLISIYQKMHERKMHVETELSEDDELNEEN